MGELFASVLFRNVKLTAILLIISGVVLGIFVTPLYLAGVVLFAIFVGYTIVASAHPEIGGGVFIFTLIGLASFFLPMCFVVLLRVVA